MILKTALITALCAFSCQAVAQMPETPPAAITAGSLSLGEGFIRATPPGSPVAGGFLSITNTGATPDRLIGGSASFAAKVEVHEMAMQGDVMKMRALPDGLPIPAGQTITLRPGGNHLMFMDLIGPLHQGDTVSVTLTFEQAGTITLPFAIVAPGARSHTPAPHGTTGQ